MPAQPYTYNHRTRNTPVGSGPEDPIKKARRKHGDIRVDNCKLDYIHWVMLRIDLVTLVERVEEHSGDAFVNLRVIPPLSMGAWLAVSA